MNAIQEIMINARRSNTVIPAFNVPYLPMVEPVIRAVIDQDVFALIATARLEWYKFESKGMAEVMAEYTRWADPKYVNIHLDHIPVIDEDNQIVDYVNLIQQAIDLGYPSVMVDGSRLPLKENIASTEQVVNLAHSCNVVCEAELGAVMGHEAGPLPPYEELFQSGRGFTDVDECRLFTVETGCDWLSVAVGNIHGAVSGAARDIKKVEARLDLAHLQKLYDAAGVPLVLHGGSGVKQEYILGAIQKGITKVNIGSEIRQAYEKGWRENGKISEGQRAVYERTTNLLQDYFKISGNRSLVNPQ